LAAPKPAAPAPPVPAPAEFAAEALTGLREAREPAAALLERLHQAIGRHLPSWRAAGAPAEALRTLSELAAELAVPTADPTEVDRRLRHAIATLEALAEPRSGQSRPVEPHRRKPFWKR
jgi:Ca-activated chloride channel family protein